MAKPIPYGELYRHAIIATTSAEENELNGSDNRAMHRIRNAKDKIFHTLLELRVLGVTFNDSERENLLYMSKIELKKAYAESGLSEGPATAAAKVEDVITKMEMVLDEALGKSPNLAQGHGRDA